MLSIVKRKTSKETIYMKKHPVPIYSLEELERKFSKSEDKVVEIANFYLSKINFDKFRFICKLVTNLDGKTPITTKLIKEYLTQFIMEAVENWLVNKMDSFYVSENLIVSVSSYGGKHYLSISPRMDFLKA